MAGEININPNILPQSGMSEESIAASAELIVTGLEKQLNIKKTEQATKDPSIELKDLEEYIQKLTETTVIDPIKPQEEQKEKEQNRKEEKKTRAKRGKKKGKEPPAAFSWMGKKTQPKREVVISAGALDKFAGKINPDDLKQYLISHIKVTLGIPQEEQQDSIENIDAFRLKLKELNINEDLINQALGDVNEIITSELSRLIKSYMLQKISSSDKFTEWIIKNKKASSLVNYALYNEFIAESQGAKSKGFVGRALQRSVSSKWKMKFKDPRELVQLALELGIDIGPWLTKFVAEKVSLTKEGTVTVNSTMIESEWQKALLLDEYKMLNINLMLEDGFLHRFSTRRRLKKVVKCLRDLGTRTPELNEALMQAKKIAWAKLISHLKESHLARVFSGSEREFEKYSLRIIMITKKAKSLGHGISKEGVKLVEGRLIELALNTASYKLQLLKSMQSIEYDKKREKDIHWLESTTTHLREREERLEFMEKVWDFIYGLFATPAKPV